MKTIYKIFQPHVGEYIEAETLDECYDKAAEVVLAFFEHQCPNAITLVEIGDDGTEVWKNLEGQNILSREERRRRVKVKLGKLLSSIPPTPIETVP